MNIDNVLPAWRVTTLLLIAYLNAAGAAPNQICTLDIVYSDSFDVSATLDLTAPGPYTVATVSGSSVQNSRATPWVASYPVSGNSAPLVVFAPGFQLSSALYQGWTAHLASWGYVAVRADPPSGFANIDQPAMAADLSNVITDVLKPAALPVTIDASQIAISGHASGGKIAFIAAASDTRIKSIFVFDPVNGANNGYSASQPNIVPQPVASIAKPTGILGELVDAVPNNSGSACAPAAINYQTIFSAEISAPVAYEWTLAGASNTSFIPDQAGCGINCGFCNPATLAAADTFAFMRSSAVAFLRTHLEGTPRLCPWLSGEKLPDFVSLREHSNP